MNPPTPDEFEVMLAQLLQDRVAASKGDRSTHWEKTRDFVLYAYRYVYEGGGWVTIQ